MGKHLANAMQDGKMSILDVLINVGTFQVIPIVDVPISILVPTTLQPTSLSVPSLRQNPIPTDHILGMIVLMKQNHKKLLGTDPWSNKTK